MANHSQEHSRQCVVVCGDVCIPEEGMSLLKQLGATVKFMLFQTSDQVAEQLTQLHEVAEIVQCTSMNDTMIDQLSILAVLVCYESFQASVWKNITMQSFLRSMAMTPDVPILVTRQDYVEFQTSSLDTVVHQCRVNFFRTLAQLDLDFVHEMENTQAARDKKLKNVLLIGNGGREHAIASKLAESPKVGHIYVAPGNGGTEAGISKISNVSLDVSQHQALVEFAQTHDIHLCVIGPEAPLVAGLADMMNQRGIPAFGPSALAAQLEASKSFSKDFMSRHGIPTAAYAIFRDKDQARAYLEAEYYLEDSSACCIKRPVIKASGIAAGKGVILPETKQEALDAIENMMVHSAFGSAGLEIVIEERLEGEEVSVLAFCDGTTQVCMPGAQDHKRIFDADLGPNTGGMGAYAPAPCLTSELETQTTALMQKTVTAMAEEGMPYVGILYGGFMLTPRDGPKVLEYNCRFGDPETQVLLPLLNSDLFDLMISCIHSNLAQAKVDFRSGAVATVVLASEGYPGSYPKGKIISGLLGSGLEDVYVFHAGTTRSSGTAMGENEKPTSITTSGGRVLAISAYGKDLSTALDRAYARVSDIHFDGMQYRRDIGLRGLLALNKDMMTTTLNVAVLGSTNGSSLQPIIDAIQQHKLPNVEIRLVLSNVTNAGILDRATKHGIPSIAMPSKSCTSRAEYDAQLSNALIDADIDLILLIGYMRILSPGFCQTWHEKVLNVHPSLLPAHAGKMDLAVHQSVLDAQDRVSGCTVHYVTPEVDAGPIVTQFQCVVDPDRDSPTSLKARVQPLEAQAFMHAIRVIQSKQSTLKSSVTYADAGVSIDAGNAFIERIKPSCKRTKRPGCDSDLGGFGGLFDLSAAGYTEDTILVACTDGVGTKLKIAQDMKTHDTVGQDLVAMCVNDLVVQGAEPLFFLDYYASGKLDVEAAAEVVKGIASGCLESKCGLIGGETAEMPSMYRDGEYDLAGFCIGAVRRHQVLPHAVKKGDVLVALPSSGIHSNGYSLVRKLIDLHHLDLHAPCPFLCRRNNEPMTLGQALLIPTRIYVSCCLSLLREERLVALAHITGGGLVENIPRILPPTLAAQVDCRAWSLPPVFGWLRKLGQLSDFELSRTFNCGVGMVLIMRPEEKDQVLGMLTKAGESPFVLGQVVEKEEESSSSVKFIGTWS